ncbi:MAG TPA: hypothetical protein VER17_13180 [Tepidisphaeraceae bacterium]|nr:hypothetical protein [Tepidisphaeraceae bacterium]
MNQEIQIQGPEEEPRAHRQGEQRELPPLEAERRVARVRLGERAPDEGANDMPDEAVTARGDHERPSEHFHALRSR